MTPEQHEAFRWDAKNLDAEQFRAVTHARFRSDLSGGGPAADQQPIRDGDVVTIHLPGREPVKRKVRRISRYDHRGGHTIVTDYADFKLDPLD